jgi:hypothetical protein
MKDEGRTNKDYSFGKEKATEERVKMELKIKNWVIGNRQ